MKIAIIGYSGSGKSTLARMLGRKYELPVLHLDAVHWLPGWEERPHAEETDMVEQFINENHSWVIDGNYNGLSYERRMEEADRIIFMNFGRFHCLYLAFKRYRYYKGETRSDMGEGCPEKLDCEFVMWILKNGRQKKQKNRFRSVLQTYGDKVTVIKNQRQLDQYAKEENLHYEES